MFSKHCLLSYSNCSRFKNIRHHFIFVPSLLRETKWVENCRKLNSLKEFNSFNPSNRNARCNGRSVVSSKIKNTKVMWWETDGSYLFAQHRYYYCAHTYSSLSRNTQQSICKFHENNLLFFPNGFAIKIIYWLFRWENEQDTQIGLDCTAIERDHWIAIEVNAHLIVYKRCVCVGILFVFIWCQSLNRCIKDVNQKEMRPMKSLVGILFVFERVEMVFLNKSTTKRVSLAFYS